MDNILPIEHVFSTLGERLFFYESKSYLETAYSDEMGSQFLLNSEEYRSLMFNIGDDINTYTPNEVYEISQLYLKRVENIISQLDSKKAKFISNKDGRKPRVIIVEMNSKEQEENYKTNLDELEFYQRHLTNIIKSREDLISIPEDNHSNKELIELTGKITIQKLEGHFNTKFSPKALALFLHYLVDAEYLINYTNASLGVVATHLFAGSDRVRQELSSISSHKKDFEELKAVLSILEKLTTSVKTDLEKLKK